ncbi:MAG TPA: DUF4136 domain-containing protein [Gemmatimonadales bacterium]|nr:DUF4136 domain-containing protein [Gemmatimonadales bacterium]
MGRVSLGLAVLALLAGCGGGGGGGGSIHVNTDYDPLATPKMSAYKTWNWLRAPAGAAGRADSAVQGLVEQAIEARLVSLGYQFTETNPEFRVGWHAALDGPLDVTTANSYYGYAWGRWFPGGGVAYSRGFHSDYQPRSLVVDVADSKASELIWRGIGRDVFTGKTPSGNRIAEAVAKMFQQFPPKGK